MSFLRVAFFLLLSFTPVSWGSQLLLNPDFESAPFPAGWTSSGGVTSTSGLEGSSTAARMPWNTSAALSQQIASGLPDFTFDVVFQILGNNESQAFRVALGNGATDLVEIRTTNSGVLQVRTTTGYESLTRISDDASFSVPSSQTVRLRIIGRDFGSDDAEYDIAWSDVGTTSTLVHAAIGLKSFAEETPGEIDSVRFVRNLSSANSFIVDNVTLEDAAAPAPAATHQVVEVTDPPPPPPPVTDKVVNISGVYPHLAVTNTDNECGIGAVVPWAGRLWAVTYAPHSANGSSDKLYEILPDLSRVIRPESVGGTPANRFIHTGSNQLIIGPHFIDADRNIRTLPYSQARGRYTATTAHLTDPDRIYIFTMEDGLYDVNVNDLSIITRYPDVQSTGDSFLSGYHGKGAYVTQGKLIVANNGEPSQSMPSGVLATWDGTVRGAGDPNPERMTAWDEIFRVQHCEVTGPGDIRGNANPATDPVWATGFDAKSVVLRTYENGQWHTWRLPKGSYTHDGAHGWHTEWPRIREIMPGTWLMHMHGIFYDFPATFSSTNFAGLTPICSYEKMPVDYAMFEGRLVMGKNDTSRFSNALVPKAQSNFWFGQLEDLEDWGAPHGHGAVWLKENVGSGTNSEPFLIEGFSQITLHLRHSSGSDVGIAIETSNGDGTWIPLRTVTIPATGYTHEILSDAPGQWVRLRTTSAANQLTAAFLLSNPFLHTTPPSLVSDEFAALADIHSEEDYTDGVIRVMNSADLPLEVASAHSTSGGTASGYHQIRGDMVLEAVTDATAENSLRTAAVLTKDFGEDAASAWVMEGSARLRLPKNHGNYEAPFASGWARGFREAVTERQMLNCHGTLYQVPRDNSGGRRRLKPITTHGKRITDFTSWRGLFVATGVLDSAPISDKVVRSADGESALWLGEVDDLWRMGEPRGTGGPWLNTSVSANAASDAYLMYGYNHKELRLTHSHGSAVVFTVEVDFLGDNTWSAYGTITVEPGEENLHVFPEGYHAHWVRVKSSVATTATAQFTYGPVEARDQFVEWAQDHGFPSGAGRAAVAEMTTQRGNPLLLEYALGFDLLPEDAAPVAWDNDVLHAFTRNIPDDQRISISLAGSPDLQFWYPRPDLEVPDVEQTSVPAGLTLRQWLFESTPPAYYLRIEIDLEP